MILLIAGKIVIGLQIVLLLIWAYSIFLTPNGTDPAGGGTAIVLLLGMAAYIATGVALLMSGKTWALVIVLVMAALPLGIAINELVKNYRSDQAQ